MAGKFYFWGPILYHTILSDDEIFRIFQLCKKDENLSYRNQLAGHIKNEYLINKIDLQFILQNHIKDFNDCHDYYYSLKSTDKKFNIQDAWVNYMKPGDFNPPHVHHSDYSSVIFLEIPEEIKEELKFSSKDGVRSPGPGSISFMADVSGHNWKKDFFPNKGDMFIFPGDLIHFVYPFKSNVERISVAYNMNLVNEKEN